MEDQEVLAQPKKKFGVNALIITSLVSIILTVLVMTAFHSNAQQSKDKDDPVKAAQKVLKQDCYDVVEMAQDFYTKQTGKQSFKSFTLPKGYIEMPNGKIEMQVVNDDELWLTATGKVNGDDKINPIQIKMVILPDRCKATIVN